MDSGPSRLSMASAQGLQRRPYCRFSSKPTLSPSHVGYDVGMRRSKRRRRVAAAIVAGSFLVTSCPALAVTTVEQGGNLIAVLGHRDDDTIEVTWTNQGALLVRDRAGITTSSCSQRDSASVVCTVGPYSASGPEVQIVGRGGDDEITLMGAFDFLLAPFVSGGPGQDVIRGSASADSLYGDQGDDLILGRGGPDDLTGDREYTLRRDGGDDTLVGGAGADRLGHPQRYGPEHGSDIYLGGPGADLLRAKDRERDKTLDGGAGKDRCRIDVRDPAPLSCEPL